jgi:hypothetical protein
MDRETIAIVGMVCAGLGIVSTVLYHIVRLKELRVLREVRGHWESLPPRIAGGSSVGALVSAVTRQDRRSPITI